MVSQATKAMKADFQGMLRNLALGLGISVVFDSVVYVHLGKLEEHRKP